MSRDSHGIGVYLKQIGRRRLLTKEQEIELSQMIEGAIISSDGTRTVVDERTRSRAKDRMIESNLRLVVSIAKGQQNKGCDLEDLIAEGNIGLMKAVEKFNWRLGYRFSTYATWWIRQAVQRLIASQGRAIKVPGRAGTLVSELKTAREEFIELNGQEPTHAELADLMNVTEMTISAAIGGLPHVVSLDVEIGAGGDPNRSRTLKDIIPDEDSESPFEALDRKQLKAVLLTVIRTLSAREEKIMRLRYGLTEDPFDHGKFPILQHELAALERGEQR